MKTKGAGIIVAAAGAAAAFGAGEARAERTKVAVLEFKAERGVDESLARLLDEIMLAELAPIESIETLGKSDIQSMLGFEKEKQLLGCTDEVSCVAEIGGALGVAKMITGQLGKVGSLFVINLKLIDIQKAKVVSRVSETVNGQEDKLIEGVRKAVRQLLGLKGTQDAIAAEPAPVPAPPPSAPAPTAAAVAPVVATSAAAAPAPATGSAAATATGAPAKGVNVGGWTTLVVGGLAAAGAAVMGVQTMSQRGKLKDLNNSGSITPGDDLKMREEIGTNALITDVLWGAGAVAGGLSIVFFVAF
jgi:TolB-like protein